MTPSEISVGRALLSYWKRERSAAGSFTALRALGQVAWEFLRDFLPSRKRQRYGDIDYDWEFRVDTTAATVSCRTRLLGLLNSLYQPIEPELFREIFNSLEINFPEFTFIDIGSGKGRGLLLAAEYPFRRIVGIELLPELNALAEQNVRQFPAEKRACGGIEALCGDATDFLFPPYSLVVFLFNPLPAAGLRKLVGNLETSLMENPRTTYVVYANPVFEEIVAGCHALRKLGGTHQYATFQTKM